MPNNNSNGTAKFGQESVPHNVPAGPARLDVLFALTTIEGRRIYVVDDHHKALAAWTIERRQLDVAPNLLTIDHHTDTHEGFLHHAYWTAYNDKSVSAGVLRDELSQKLDWRVDASVLGAIELLHHDEHIHAATQSGVLSDAFCIQLSDGDGWPSIEDEARHALIKESYDKGDRINVPEPVRPMTYRGSPDSIYVIGYKCAIECAKSTHDDNCQIIQSSQIIESKYLEDQLARAREISNSLGKLAIEKSVYILDIDLDVFHTAKSIDPDDSSVFYKLIRGAVAITVATEASCVEHEWLDQDVRLTAPELLERVLNHIETALAS